MREGGGGEREGGGGGGGWGGWGGGRNTRSHMSLILLSKMMQKTLSGGLPQNLLGSSGKAALVLVKKSFC